uniref:Uncharacterized protein n=1 Tax=Oryza sativa subsp. japonica TaxID=39947 RepID=Q10JD5_ORYSJ|nr:hypothetical protein LOC_Os03g31079 [Oryza sativa Japonica Group]
MPPPYSHIKVPQRCCDLPRDPFFSRRLDSPHQRKIHWGFGFLTTCWVCSNKDSVVICEMYNFTHSSDRFNFLQEKLTEKFGTPLQCQRLWWWARRQNNTYRVDRPLTTEEENLPVSKTL